MRNAAAGYAFVLLLSSTVVAAQDAKVTTDAKVTSDDGKVIKMTGCVEIGGGTSFVLTNITSEQDQSQQSQQESNQMPTGGSYPLIERKGLDLGPFILQKVELTGVVSPPQPGAILRTKSRSRKRRGSTLSGARQDVFQSNHRQGGAGCGDSVSRRVGQNPRAKLPAVGRFGETPLSISDGSPRLPTGRA